MKYPDRGLNIALFKENPTLYLTNVIKRYVAESPLNCMPALDYQPMYDEPLVAFADGDDPAFQALKESAGEYLLTPRELLEGHLATLIGRPPKDVRHVSVISMALPMHRGTRLEERRTRHGCSLHFNYTRFIGGQLPFIPSSGFLDRLMQYLESFLIRLDHLAIAPSQSGIWNQRFKRAKATCRTAISNWSERHVAEIAGLGTFGLSGNIITARGIAVNLTSVICNVALTPTRSGDAPVTPHCLFYRERTCRQCVQRCPGGAITERGRDALKCHSYSMYEVPRIMSEEGRSDEQMGFYFPCGKCMVNVPCEDRVPPSIA